MRVELPINTDSGSNSMRLPYVFAALVSISLVACNGNEGDNTPDEPVDIGFNTPTVTLKANNEPSENNWTKIGPADLSCLGMPPADAASAVDVTINTKVTDFQSGNAVPGAMVQVFKD